jgi:hypothetical protein
VLNSTRRRIQPRERDTCRILSIRRQSRRVSPRRAGDPTILPATLATANALCVAEFGAGWRVAEFHDGWGWNFQAFGGLGKPAGRFWVNIDDQPGGVCW